MKKIMAIAALCALCATTQTHAIGLNSGIAASVAFPQGDFGDVYDSGWGISAIYDFTIVPLVAATGTLGWTQFSSDAPGVGDVDVWEFAFGAHVKLGLLYAGAETGYYTEIKEWGITPLAGVRFWKADVSLRYSFVDNSDWLAIRAGIFF